MANSICFTFVGSFNTPNKPGIIVDNSFPRKVLRVNDVFKSSRNARLQSLEAKIKIKVLNQIALSVRIVMEMVPNSVLNAKVPELILLITSMDNLKLVGCVGFAGEKGRFYVGIVMALALSVDL